MSAVRWLRELAGFGLSLLGAVVGWLLLAPIALLIPKRRDLVVVIGRQNGRFLDNAKYFFLTAACSQQAFRVVFVGEHPEVQATISAHGLLALRYPTAPAIWSLLRCSVAVVDSTDWIRHLRRFLLLKAHVVQLWHGVAFKRIELDKWRHETGRYKWLSSSVVFYLRMMLYRFNGRIVQYAAVCATSHFYRDEVFSQAFLARHFPITGYPRNGFGGGLPPRARELAWTNVDARVRSRLGDWAARKRKPVLVAPTMRDSLSPPLLLDEPTLREIDAFASVHGYEFLFKFHPSDKHAAQVTGSHLHVCAGDSDVYPLLPFCTALITDYSSIYMDFLLTDKPVLFLISDGTGYMRDDRETQFDATDMMPGPRFAAWSALLEQLALPQAEAFLSQREALRRKAFDDLPQSEATQKVIRFMRSHRWTS